MGARLVLLILGAALIAVMYRSGIAVSKSITALLFIFRPGKDEDRVTLDACTGWVRHRGRFRESRVYDFVLKAWLSQGTASVILLDAKGREILRLDRGQTAGSVKLDGAGRYTLRWEFRDAAGTCSLRW